MSLSKCAFARLLVLVWFCLYPGDALHAQEAVIEMLPTGKLDAVLMEPGSSARCEALSARFGRAVAKNRDWWIETIRQIPEGQPPPYDSRLGLSEAEYSELQECADSMEMRRVGSDTLTVEESPAGVLTLRANGLLAKLDGIQIDTQNDEVRTPLGTATERSEITTQATSDSPLGSWSGVQWELKPDVDPSSDLSKLSASIVRFCVGRRAGSGGVIYYNATLLQSGAKVARVLMVVYYDLPPSVRNSQGG